MLTWQGKPGETKNYLDDFSALTLQAGSSDLCILSLKWPMMYVLLNHRLCNARPTASSYMLVSDNSAWQH